MLDGTKLWLPLVLVFELCGSVFWRSIAGCLIATRVNAVWFLWLCPPNSQGLHLSPGFVPLPKVLRAEVTTCKPPRCNDKRWLKASCHFDLKKVALKDCMKGLSEKGIRPA